MPKHTMKIFVTIKTPRADAFLNALAAQLETEITHAGFTPFIATKELEKRGLTPGFMQYIRQQIEQSDVLLLLYHPDLRGGLIEQGIAYTLHIPVWLAHPTGEKISTTARECATQIIPYTSHQDLLTRLHQAFQSLKENK